MTIEVAAVDGKPLKEKKSGKSHKEKLQSDGTMENHDAGNSDRDRKKKRKKKNKQDAEAVQNIAGADEPKAKKHKSDKKRKLKDVEIAESSPASPIPDNVESAESCHKKSKKRKADSDKAILHDPIDTVDQPSQQPKKHKKRKRDIQEDTPTNLIPSTDKKEKEKESQDNVVEVSPNNTGGISSLPVSINPQLSSPSSSKDIESFLSKHSITIHASSKGGTVTPILAFDQLEVPQDLKFAFTGFEEPTPIQACSWPPALQGQDVVGIAETGSGKTLAFGIPALSRLISTSSSKKSNNDGIQILVMSPTRELAIQTHETLLELGKPFGITSVAVFGGVDKGGQIKALKDKKAKIVVGTPGRIMDLVNDGVCDLSRVSYLVLDEADRMLDKGFENDIRTIIGYAKQGEERQTLMFSATWPDVVRKLAGSFQRDPVRVTVGSDDLTANSRVEQVVEVFDDARSKDSRLLGHLRRLLPKTSKLPSLDDARVLVFVLYKKEASRVESMLHRQNYSVTALHGDLSQAVRIEALQNFKTGKTRILVATDVAARGLDIPNVAVVLNYSFPLTIEDYIHRIGRTGRGGKSGKSITFFTGDNHERALAGELARVLRESGFDIEPLKKFPMTIKKKSHSVYGAFYREDVAVPSGPTKIKF